MITNAEKEIQFTYEVNANPDRLEVLVRMLKCWVAGIRYDPVCRLVSGSIDGTVR